jgi:glycosyltransferase involved in cell wall biosynthesis
VTTQRRLRLLVDVTQFASWPATSGVQRVLRHFVSEWRSDYLDAAFGFVDGDRYVTGHLCDLASVVASTFETGSVMEIPDIESRSEAVRGALRSGGRAVATSNLEGSFDAYLLPEPTLSRASLNAAIGLLRSQRTTPFFIHYDALPLTHPHLYPRGADADAAMTRYHRVLARAKNVAFISENARATFESRIARRQIANAAVVRPGADGLRRTDPSSPRRPTFVAIGTIEPRKRHRLLLATFEELWRSGRDYALVVIGGRGWERPDLFDLLAEYTRAHQVEWIDRARDQDISAALARSSGLVFLSDAEGYGLPPLEALALGCPVVVASGLPALESLPSNGQIRLDDITVAAIRRALETLADPDQNALYRAATRELNLPTWSRFAQDIESWIAGTLEVATGRAPHR